VSDLRAELFSRLADPRAIPILLRHAIPVIGVFVFGWSPLETVAALVLDAVSTLWMVGATGSYFAAKDLDHGEPGLSPALHFWAGFLGLFLFVAGLLTFAVLVPAAFLLPLVSMADVDPWELVQNGWVARVFAFIILCQVPSFVQRIRALQASGLAPEKMGMDAEVGFVLHRMATLAGMSTMLALFGPYALHVLVIVAQAFGAGTEIMRDRYVGALMRTSGPRQPAAGVRSRGQRKRRRR
jgi:hypothetical protein